VGSSTHDGSAVETRALPTRWLLAAPWSCPKSKPSLWLRSSARYPGRQQSPRGRQSRPPYV